MTKKKNDARRAGSGQPKGVAGESGPGRSFTPASMECDETAPEKAKPAPSPGVPMSNERYELLKRKAKTERAVRSRFAQSDPSD